MHDALRFSGRPAGIQDEKGILGIQRGCIASVGRGVHQLLPPVVAASLHLDRGSGSTAHDGMFYGGAVFEGLIHVFFEGKRGSLAVSAVGRNDESRLGIVDPVLECLGREAPENDAVRGPDPGAGQHRNRKLRDHRHVDRHAVPRDQPEGFQDICKPAHLAVQLLKGQGAGVARLALPDDGCLVLSPGGKVSIQAVIGNVRLSPDEPLGERGLPFQDLLPRFEPMQLLCDGGPEFFRVLGRRAGQTVIVPAALDVRAAAEGRARPDQPALAQDRVDVRACLGLGHNFPTFPEEGRFN